MSYNKQIEELKETILGELKSTLKNKDIIEISLNNPPIYQYIDEQYNQVIYSINSNTEKFGIDDGMDVYWKPLTDLSIEQLAYILDEVENENYEIEE